MYECVEPSLVAVIKLDVTIRRNDDGGGVANFISTRSQCSATWRVIVCTMYNVQCKDDLRTYAYDM